MKKSFFFFTIFIMTFLLFPSFTFAKTGYVSDMLLLTFRQGPGNSFAVTKTLKSNTPVSILGEENGFYKVELQSREIGWVDKKFIIFEQPKTYIIAQLKKENKRLEDKLLALEVSARTLRDETLTQKNDFSQTTQDLEVSLKAAVAEKNNLANLLSQAQDRYNTLIKQSKNIQKIVKENAFFQKENNTLSKEVNLLKGKNKNLLKTGMIKWFLAGVGVLLLGWIIGQSVSSKKRKSSSLLD